MRIRRTEASGPRNCRRDGQVGEAGWGQGGGRQVGQEGVGLGYIHLPHLRFLEATPDRAALEAAWTQALPCPMSEAHELPYEVGHDPGC